MEESDDILDEIAREKQRAQENWINTINNLQYQVSPSH